MVGSIATIEWMVGTADQWWHRHNRETSATHHIADHHQRRIISPIHIARKASDLNINIVDIGHSLEFDKDSAGKQEYARWTGSKTGRSKLTSPRQRAGILAGVHYLPDWLRAVESWWWHHPTALATRKCINPGAGWTARCPHPDLE